MHAAITVLSILFGAAFTVAVSTAAGKLLLGFWTLPLDRAEHHFFSFVTGAALLSTITFLTCAAHVARPGVFLALGLAILLACFFLAGAGGGRREGRPPVTWTMLLLVLGGAYTGLYLINALAPEYSPDGSTYHLGLVARYLREHGFHRVTTNMYANLSQGVEMLFLFAFAFGRHSAAAMTHFAFLLALAAAMVLYGRRMGMWPAGIGGALLVLASPLMGIDGSTAYVDVAVACIVFADFYLLEIWDAGRSAALLAPIGLLAGFAYAAKYTAGVAVFYAVGFVAWRNWRSRNPVLMPALTVALCALAVMLPWMIRNSIWYENPFSPFLNRLFPNPYFLPGQEESYVAALRQWDAGILKIPWALTVDGRLAGFFGPVFLLAPIALVTLGRREGRRLLAAAAVFGSGWLLNLGARFLIPALPFVALAMAMALMRWRRLLLAVVAVHAILSWPAIASRYCDPSAYRLRDFPWRAALRLEPQDSFLAARSSAYARARLIEQLTARSARIFSMIGAADAYTSREILQAYASASNEVLRDVLWTPLIPQATPDRMLTFRFPRQALRRIRVVETARAAPDQWSISELRVYREGRELAREPTWRIHAEPNPWEIQLAFDNSPVTRWRAWAPADPGEFVQVDFGRLQVIDTVALQCSRDQDRVRLRLDGGGESGEWKTILIAPEVSAGPPMPQLRRLAASELKARGIDYLIVDESDLGSGDFKFRPQEWGMTPVGAAAGARLYRLW